MRLHTLSGDRSSALRVYHTCATVLERELAVAPGPATRDAYERLVHLEALPMLPAAPAPPALVAVVSLVGRQSEWAQLQAAWRAAEAGGAHTVLIAGEAGIGKTRLAEELLVWADRHGIVTAAAAATRRTRLRRSSCLHCVREGRLIGHSGQDNCSTLCLSYCLTYRYP